VQPPAPSSPLVSNMLAQVSTSVRRTSLLQRLVDMPDAVGALALQAALGVLLLRWACWPL
jgi:hypothetical protein